MLVFALSILLSFILIAIALPLALGRVPPNPWYGFRVGRATEDQRAWYAANRASGRWLAGAGCALAAAAVVNVILGTLAGLAAMINALVLTLGIIAAVAAGFAAMNRDDFPHPPAS